MENIYTLDQIKGVLRNINAVKAVEDGFIALSEGKAVIPPVGELLFDNPPGDLHIKYGKITGDEYFVIKVATGYFENYKLDLPSGTGLMLVFRQKTGELAGILLDEGYLTNLRTAAAGAVAAKYLAPEKVNCIGIYGAGIQGRMQVEVLKELVECNNVMVWGNSENELAVYKEEMEVQGYNVTTTREENEIPEACNLIITATPSRRPLLKADRIKKGTHITAMGSDTQEKQELEAEILKMADIVAADSIIQAESRGEIFKALSGGTIKKEKIVELGNVIKNKALQRADDNQITVADLTGVAVQDIQISVAVYEALQKSDNI